MGPNIGQNVSIKAHRITNMKCFIMEAQSLQIILYTQMYIYIYIY